MPRIGVKMVTHTNAALCRLRQLMKTVHHEVCRRAFCIYQQKGTKGGHELEDWLEAEREVICSPPCELAESGDEIRIQAAMPGLVVRNLQVDVLPNSITIEGKVARTQARSGEEVHFSEFGEKRLLRQFDLPAQIDPNEVQASLENGNLSIVAKKMYATVPPAAHEPKHARRAAA